MQLSLRLGKKRGRLYSRYKRELLEKRTDNRLQPAQAIEYGLKYFAKLMKVQRGDMSLALASYNTGPNRIKRFNGLPPYGETVRYRNKVLEYYRDYLRKAKGNR
jgi:soluble lytic murein transglycosylase-like protein